VRVDLFVMSKCPDAYVCEELFQPIITQVGSIVDLNVNYIAQVDDSQPTGFNCMHGQSECTGDIQQLCAKKYYPFNYVWWNFLLCQDNTQDDIPDNGVTCAKQYFMNPLVINNFTNGQDGKDLMTKSITFTQSKNIDVSCTIYIMNQLYCVHNGDWENCQSHDPDEIVQYICNNYSGPSPPSACNQ